MSDQIRINGKMHSWASLKLKAANEVYSGFNSISFGDKRERVKGYGMGRHHAPRGRSAGKYTPEPVKVAGPTGSCEAFRQMLAKLAPDGVSIGDVEFEIQLQYVETLGSSEVPINVVMERCVLSGDTASHEENPDPLKEELEFDTMRIRRNGLTMFDSSEGSP